MFQCDALQYEAQEYEKNKVSEGKESPAKEWRTRKIEKKGGAMMEIRMC